MGLRDSTTLAPQMFEKAQYVQNFKEICLSLEQTQHVYRALERGEHVTPLSIVTQAQHDQAANKSCNNTESSQDEHNPYEAALTQDIDFQCRLGPGHVFGSSDVTWSILNTEIMYKGYSQNTFCKYSPIYHSNIFKSLF